MLSNVLNFGYNFRKICMVLNGLKVMKLDNLEVKKVYDKKFSAILQESRRKARKTFFIQHIKHPKLAYQHIEHISCIISAQSAALLPNFPLKSLHIPDPVLVEISTNLFVIF